MIVKFDKPQPIGVPGDQLHQQNFDSEVKCKSLSTTNEMVLEDNQVDPWAEVIFLLAGPGWPS